MTKTNDNFFFYDDDTTSNPIICQTEDEEMARTWARDLFRARSRNDLPARSGILYQERYAGDISVIEEFGPNF